MWPPCPLFHSSVSPFHPAIACKIARKKLVCNCNLVGSDGKGGEVDVSWWRCQVKEKPPPRSPHLHPLWQFPSMIQYAVSVVDSADDRRSLHSLPLYPLEYTPPSSSTLHWEKYFLIQFLIDKLQCTFKCFLSIRYYNYNYFPFIFDSILKKVP